MNEWRVIDVQRAKHTIQTDAEPDILVQDTNAGRMALCLAPLSVIGIIAVYIKQAKNDF